MASSGLIERNIIISARSSWVLAWLIPVMGMGAGDRCDWTGLISRLRENPHLLRYPRWATPCGVLQRTPQSGPTGKALHLGVFPEPVRDLGRVGLGHTDQIREILGRIQRVEAQHKLVDFEQEGELVAAWSGH